MESKMTLPLLNRTQLLIDHAPYSIQPQCLPKPPPARGISPRQRPDTAGPFCLMQNISVIFLTPDAEAAVPAAHAGAPHTPDTPLHPRDGQHISHSPGTAPAPPSY